MPTNPLEPIYVVKANSEKFTLISDRRESGPYPLPFYNDGIGRLERTAWTPLTVTADLTIVGGVLALICWEALAESNASFTVH